MEIIKIGNDAMKISLCTKEAEECGFDLDKTQEEMKRSFINLLMKAKRVVDFKVASEKLTGEMFSAKDGGCEIFVSCVEVGDAVYKERMSQEMQKKPRQTNSIVCFDSINDVITVSAYLYRQRQLGGALYFDEEREKYYIILDEVSVKDIKFAFLTEYGTVVKSNMIHYIKEHFKCVCKRNAIEKLSKC